ncbi:MAG: D-alanyl-D-alanine carboxypeptidase [Methylococcaceae bacterium]|nr:D-alanyl-D-alanine carboxypeptidase [Methylococcaceae bacterium]
MMLSQLSYGRHAAILIDADNGNVLYELEANQSWYPASLTKLMTLYMTFSALESGRLRLSHEMTVSHHAARQPTSKLGLRPWESISVEDAILAIITRSANDASVVLAEEIAGSEQQFAIKMTSTAHSLGMYGSHFMNATGLPHDWQTTTAHDMALLALRIKRDFPQYYPYFAADGMYFKGREYRGINKFTANYPGAEGMKTGYTCGSGYNLVSSAHQYGKRLIGVVLGGKSSSERYEHMFTMMDMGFSDFDNGYHSKNIQTMNKNSVGVPPYQLSCGHRPSSYYASSRHHHTEDEDDHKVRYVRKTTRIPHIASYSRPIEHPPVTKIRIAGKTKTIVKESNIRHSAAKINVKTAHSSSKASKSSVHTKVTADNSKSTKKSTSSASKSKTITVASKSKSKGYYSPASSKKSVTPASSDSKKGKSSKKPDTSEKTVAKNTSKSKRTTKSKS